MENEGKISGGCYCGKVRYAVKGEPVCQTNCHCSNCRLAIGAQAVAWVIVKREHFSFRKGKPKRFRTFTKAWRTFCEVCGTSLTYESDGREDEVDITTGSLDNPEEYPPKTDTFKEEKLAWVKEIQE